MEVGPIVRFIIIYLVSFYLLYRIFKNFLFGICLAARGYNARLHVNWLRVDFLKLKPRAWIGVWWHILWEHYIISTPSKIQTCYWLSKMQLSFTFSELIKFWLSINCQKFYFSLICITDCQLWIYCLSRYLVYVFQIILVFRTFLSQFLDWESHWTPWESSVWEFGCKWLLTWVDRGWSYTAGCYIWKCSWWYFSFENGLCFSLMYLAILQIWRRFDRIFFIYISKFDCLIKVEAILFCYKLLYDSFNLSHTSNQIYNVNLLSVMAETLLKQTLFLSQSWAKTKA